MKSSSESKSVIYRLASLDFEKPLVISDFKNPLVTANLKHRVRLSLLKKRMLPGRSTVQRKRGWRLIRYNEKGEPVLLISKPVVHENSKLVLHKPHVELDDDLRWLVKEGLGNLCTNPF